MPSAVRVPDAQIACKRADIRELARQVRLDARAVGWIELVRAAHRAGRLGEPVDAAVRPALRTGQQRGVIRAEPALQHGRDLPVGVDGGLALQAQGPEASQSGGLDEPRLAHDRGRPSNKETPIKSSDYLRPKGKYNRRAMGRIR
jgi:hypothetical protein